MISTLLDRLFHRTNIPSGSQVKKRLKFILAHDRAAIEPQVFDNMRHEIMRVVSKYVELDESALDIRLESDRRMTALIANLPIKTVREELPDLVKLFDAPINEPTNEPIAKTSESPSQLPNKDISITPNITPNPELSTTEMDLSVQVALDAIAAQEVEKSQEVKKSVEILDNGQQDQKEKPSDRLELSLNLPHTSESQEVVVEESPELFNQP